MAMTEKVTVSLDRDTLFLVRRAAELAGLPLSTYVSRAARDYALRCHPGPSVTEVDQRADEVERAAEENAYRAAG